MAKDEKAPITRYDLTTNASWARKIRKVMLNGEDITLLGVVMADTHAGEVWTLRDRHGVRLPGGDYHKEFGNVLVVMHPDNVDEPQLRGKQ